MADASTKYPRVTIEFCTQCRWMLRAAWFAQELLSTFSNSIGEVALQPATGGTFTVHLFTAPEEGQVTAHKHLLWDRDAEDGFPEAKELKRRVRDIIDPERDLGHVDRKKATDKQTPTPTSSNPPIPRALNRLQAQLSPGSERKFTPMDVDPPSGNERGFSGNVSGTGEEEEVGEGNSRVGPSCPPGEDCDER